MDMHELEEIMKALDSQKGILFNGFTHVSLHQVCKVEIYPKDLDFWHWTI